MKYLAIVLTLFVCGALAQEGFEDLLTPEERTEAERVKSFSHYLTEGTELEEPYQSALEETLGIVGIGESDDLEFEGTKGNTTRMFKCKANNCTLCFKVRRFGRFGRKIKICFRVGRRAYNLTLTITRGSRTVLSGSTPARNTQPICKQSKCPLFGPFCAIFAQVKKTTSGYTGCVVGKATIFKKKVMHRKVGCFKLTNPKRDLDLGLHASDLETGSALSWADAYRKMKMLKQISNRILKTNLKGEEEESKWAPIF